MEKRIEHTENTNRIGNILIKKINQISKIEDEVKNKKELRKFYDYIVDNINTIVPLFPSEILKQISSLILKHRKNNFLTEKKYDIIINFVLIDEKICGLYEECTC